MLGALLLVSFIFRNELMLLTSTSTAFVAGSGLGSRRCILGGHCPDDWRLARLLSAWLWLLGCLLDGLRCSCNGRGLPLGPIGGNDLELGSGEWPWLVLLMLMRPGHHQGVVQVEEGVALVRLAPVGARDRHVATGVGAELLEALRHINYYTQSQY